MLGYVQSLHGELHDPRARNEQLAAKLNQNSSNSNKPPSSDSPFKDRKTKPAKARKKRKGHRQQCLRPTEVREVLPTKCTCGCTDIAELEPYYIHQVIGLPQIELDVVHFVLNRGHCPECGKAVKATIPPEHRAGFGPRLSAMIAEMVGRDPGRQPADRPEFLRLSVSQGAIQKILDRASAAIKPHYEAIAAVARTAEVNHIDETSWRTGKALRWLWVMDSSLVAFFMIHEKRSKAAFKALIEDWSGILVSDGYGVYMRWEGQRQACLAHLIRQAKGLSERKDADLARIGTWVLKELGKLCHMAKDKPSVGEWRAFYARFIRLVILHGARQDEAGTLVRRLHQEMENLWLFLREEGVAPTNNHAERLLRFAVLWRKVSFGTSNEKGERWVERILPLRQTCKLRGKRSFPVLVDAISSFFNGKAPDTAWIRGSAS